MISRKLFLRFSMVALFFVFLLSFNSSAGEENVIQLHKGKNFVNFNLSNPISVKTLIELNPEIEAVSFFEGNYTVGYVSAFGGVGKNFFVADNVTYEIFISKDTTINLPV